MPTREQLGHALADEHWAGWRGERYPWDTCSDAEREVWRHRADYVLIRLAELAAD